MLAVLLATIAQTAPGGPKIWDELDSMTSSTATAAIETPAEPRRRRGILGINVAKDRGKVIVRSIKRGGPAHRAGIRKGDTIQSIDRLFLREQRDFVRLMANKRAGDRVTVVWASEEGLESAEIELEAGQPLGEEEVPKPIMTKRRGILGINVVNLGGRVRVKSIKPDGAADKAGIRKWDTIRSIDDEPVGDRSEYVKRMADKVAGETVTVEWIGENGQVSSMRVVLDAGNEIVSTERKGKQLTKLRRERPKKVRTRKWYGWQPLVCDIVALPIVLASLLTDNSAILGGIGLVGYAIGAPMTHLFHGNLKTGLLSMGLRVAIPSLTVLGTLAICDEADMCKDATALFAIGALLTFLAIPAVDSAVLSWEKLEPPPTETTIPLSLAPSIAPTTDGGVTFGLAGLF